MKPPTAFSSSGIEVLEQRIAPALLVTGANLLGGAGNPTSGQASIGGHSLTLVQVTSGEAIVWYGGGSIQAISVGPNTSLSITGDVGVIVANLTSTGQLSGSAANNTLGDVLLPNNITGIVTHPLATEQGSIGEIITGGSVTNLNISGSLSGIYTGDAIFKSAVQSNSNPSLLTNDGIVAGVSVPGISPPNTPGGGPVAVNVGIDVNPVVAGFQGGFTFTQANAGVSFLSGASISNVTVQTGKEMQIFSGDGLTPAAGKPGLPGGPITNIDIKSAFAEISAPGSPPSYKILSGDGSNGTTGGAGGAITKIVEVTSSGAAVILSGIGGNGSTGAGGNGGAISTLNLQSDATAYTVHSGHGGNGSPGGAGGAVTNVNFSGNSSSGGIVLHGNFVTPFFPGNTPTNDVNDVVIIDGSTGGMIVEANNNGNFTPIVQYTVTNTPVTQIQGDGVTPISAVAVDVNGDGYTDIVVAYKNSENLGVFINQGNLATPQTAGTFYQAQTTNNVVTEVEQVNSVSLNASPNEIAAGSFTGTGNEDIAILSGNSAGSTLSVAQNDGTGSFTILNNSVSLEKNPTSLVSASFSGNGYDNGLFAGFQSGDIVPVFSNLSVDGVPQLTVEPVKVTMGAGVGGMDVDNFTSQLLAYNLAGNTVNIYTWSSSGVLTLQSALPVSSQPGHVVSAEFVNTLTYSQDPIAVLSSLPKGSRVDVYSSNGSSYSISNSTTTSEILTSITTVVTNTGGTVTFGEAALSGGVSDFAFTQNSGGFTDYSLPFASKTVDLASGDGGTGFGTGHGGAGGAMNAITANAYSITVVTGDGGGSANGAAGAGGSIVNPATQPTSTGTVACFLDALNALTVTTGIGGTATGTVKTATGGAGGSMTGLSLNLLANNIAVTAGTGGTGGGGAGGAGGSVLQMKAVNQEGGITVTAGTGGAATGALGNGGAGGSITKMTHQLALSATGLTVEQSYDITLVAGIGGTSASGTGGAGGSITTLNMTEQPPNESVEDSTNKQVHLVEDSTVVIDVTAGDGGQGAIGGLGGALTTVNITAVFDQSVPGGGVLTNPIVAELNSGNGGKGTKGAGGAGGAIGTLSLVGISHYDTDAPFILPAITPPASALTITSGYGGDGATTGGVGGAIKNVISSNATVVNGMVADTNQLSGAIVTSGHGGAGGSGAGGAGGGISQLSIATQSYYILGDIYDNGGPVAVDGSLTVTAGYGGAGSVGGAGGSVTSSYLATADTVAAYGLFIKGGAGGAGTVTGGAGGSLSTLQLNTPQDPEVAPPDNTTLPTSDSLTALLLAGNGGGGGSGLGGVGGGISGITQTKDLNSTINLIQAGNGGGSALAGGGLGGSVTNIQSVGLIGQTSDGFGNSFGVFQTNLESGLFSSLFPAGIPQGLFAGRGGVGKTATGVNGSVTSVKAADIAAIGAAIDSNGFFAAAAKVANITAQSIAYDQNGNSLYDNAASNHTSAPDTSVAIDGFIFSETPLVSVVVTGGQTDLANFEFIV